MPNLQVLLVVLTRVFCPLTDTMMELLPADPSFKMWQMIASECPKLAAVEGGSRTECCDPL